MSCDDEVTAVPVHEMEDCDRIDLAWKRLLVQVRQGDKNILLRGVSGAVSEGLIAVMGPSGSGKTTLLNALACRLDREVKVSGDFRINGEPYTTSTLKRFLGYVMQDDVHSEVLTVRETLRFVADTRLAKTHTPKQREKRINTVMEQMTLSHVADVRVGRGNSGIAGGEKKRLSVAKELLGNPRMLFLDEPTSNLDSLDALQFVQSLKRLVAKTRCVVVCTIHQPQYKVFSTFERLIMLREGSIIYDGPIQGVREYCAQIGSPCPASANPADHMMAAISSENPETVSDENTRKLEEMFTTVHDLVDVDRGKGRAARYMRTPVPFVIQCRMGLLRATVLLARRRTEWIIYLIVTIVNAVLVGTVFLRIGTGPSSIVKRSPALFFVVVNQATFGAISTISVLPGERAVILRERASGNLSALSYFATKAFAEMVWKLPFPIIFSIITYFLIGFQPTAHHFFRYLGTIVLSFLTGMGVAFAVSGLIRVASIASIVLPLIMELSRLFAGYFLAPSLQFPGLRWIDYLSYIHYGYNAVSQNEMGDLVIAGAPQVNTLHSKGLYMSYSESMGILGCYFVITLIIAYLGVRFITW